MSKNTRKVIVIIGTRPEAIKMWPVIYELQQRRDLFQPVVLVTGQHKEMLAQVLNIFRIKPDYDLGLMEKNQTLPRLTAKAVPVLDRVIQQEQPDILLVQGDTTTSFVASLAAFYQKVKIGHIEAGLRTYQKYNPFPEEINRALISVLTDLHFAPTEVAAENLRKEGIAPDSIYITGNTVIDALYYIVENCQDEMKNIHANVINNNNRHILLTAHRRENFGLPLRNICQAVKDLISMYEDIEITYPVHKNPNVRDEVYSQLSGLKRVHLIEPADYLHFVKLMNESYFILTDSGGIQEEAPSLGKPVLVLRSETERPEAVAAGTAKVVGTEVENIVSHSRLLLDDRHEYERMANAVNPYGDGTAGKQIVDIIQSCCNA